jgi:DNA-binding transcriptional regulator YiaG
MMDKRYNALSMNEQIALRHRAVTEVLEHPEWTLPEAIRHLRTTMRITTAELAMLAKVGHRTLQDIEQGVSPGTVQVLNKVLGVLGLKLGIVRARPPVVARDAAGGGSSL